MTTVTIDYISANNKSPKLNRSYINRDAKISDKKVQIYNYIF